MRETIERQEGRESSGVLLFFGRRSRRRQESDQRTDLTTLGAFQIRQLEDERSCGDGLPFEVHFVTAMIACPFNGGWHDNNPATLISCNPYASQRQMKAKGVAELGICGVTAAVANATYNATGVRVRDYPVTLDKLLDKLPSVS